MTADPADIIRKIGDPWHGSAGYHCLFCGTTDPENHDYPRCPQPDINTFIAANEGDAPE